MPEGLVFRLKKVFEKTEPKEEAKTYSEEKASTSDTILPIKVECSINPEEANKAKEELNLLSLEKEITSYAITRLFEAEAEGKITKEERTQLVNKYKEELKSLNLQIDKKQMMVKLFELENAQSELVKMFHDKYGEINKNIEGIRNTLKVSTKEIVSLKPNKVVKPQKEENTPPPREDKAAEKPASKLMTPPKTKADEKIEEIQEEVLKMLERLEQMETET